MHTGGAPDIVVAWIAARQLGLITAAQLIAAGVGRGSIRWRLANGALHRVFRGVYLVGHAVPPPGAVEFAAVLACGHEAVVSHRSAVVVWRLGLPLVGEVEVTVAGRDCRSRAGLRVYQVQELRCRRSQYERRHPSHGASPHAHRLRVDHGPGGGGTCHRRGVRAQAGHRVRRSSTQQPGPPIGPAWPGPGDPRPAGWSETDTLRRRTGDAATDSSRWPPGAAH